MDIILYFNVDRKRKYEGRGNYETEFTYRHSDFKTVGLETL